MRSCKIGVFLLFAFFNFFTFINRSEANVILKVMGVNPSKEETQSVILKAYLPKEVKPEDVLDKGDLEVIYDTQQGSYYVYGDYELKPQETIEREIEIKDIWLIPGNELESVRSEATQTIVHLQNTDLKERAKFLKDSIESKLNEIAEKQKSPQVNPQKRISDYRDNLKLLESVKTDLVLLRSLLAQAKPMSQATVWVIFLSVVGFLGFLALALYFIWHKQLRDINTSGAPYNPAAAKEESAAPLKHEAKPEKKIDSAEIERILKQDE